jgi:hypothetical protein
MQFFLNSVLTVEIISDNSLATNVDTPNGMASVMFPAVRYTNRDRACGVPEFYGVQCTDFILTYDNIAQLNCVEIQDETTPCRWEGDQREEFGGSKRNGVGLALVGRNDDGLACIYSLCSTFSATLGHRPIALI